MLYSLKIDKLKRNTRVKENNELYSYKTIRWDDGVYEFVWIAVHFKHRLIN